MCLDQFVAHCLDIIDIQLCCGMWFEHGGLIDLFFGSGGCGFDGQELDVNIGHIHGCQLDRESSYVAWVDAVGIYHTRNFHTGIGWQVVDQTGIQHIATDLIWIAGHDGFHNIRSIFFGSFVGYFSVFQNIFPFFLPAFDLLHTSAWVFVQRDVVFFDHFRISGFDK